MQSALSASFPGTFWNQVSPCWLVDHLYQDHLGAGQGRLLSPSTDAKLKTSLPDDVLVHKSFRVTLQSQETAHCSSKREHSFVLSTYYTFSSSFADACLLF